MHFVFVPEKNIAVNKNLNGDRSSIAIERAINELRCGRAIYLNASAAVDPDKRGALLASAETVSTALLARIEQAAGSAGLALAITYERAEVLGLQGLDAFGEGEKGAVLLHLKAPVSAATVALLAGAGVPEMTGAHALPLQARFSRESADSIAIAALNLAKQARLLPAVLVAASAPPLPEEEILQVSAPQLEELAQPERIDLECVSSARVPLAGHEDSRLVLFRDRRNASEHVAIVIGVPDVAAVPVRLHSACLTGDLLGSLRCDCGDQLRGAVDQLAAAGGGVLLYLAQEGRGIGLANKLRAYELQDQGLDTIEADRHLGFRADERSYAAAAAMLRQLGMTRIQLLTNNLDKMESLRNAGIEVVSGKRLLGAINRHNVHYIRTKRERAGHLMPEIEVEGL
jgi:GTP cyclohydrolase II